MGNDLSRVREGLKGVTVKEILDSSSKGEVTTIEHNASVSSLIHILKERSIIAVPVIRRGKMVGFVGLPDIVEFLFSDDDSHELSSLSHSGDSLQSKIARVQDKFDTLEVSVLVGMHHNNHMMACQATDSLWDVLHLFANKAPRLAVFNGGNHLVAILSQMDVLCYLAAHVHILGSVRNMTPEELHLISPVLTVSPSEPIAEAFSLMTHHRTEGIALVDDEGDLLYHLSMSDFKYLYSDMYLLRKSARRYVETVRKLKRDGNAHGHHHNHRRKHAVGDIFNCQADEPLKNIVKEMAKHKVHSIYVVKGNKGVGVVNIRRVCQSLFHLLA